MTAACACNDRTLGNLGAPRCVDVAKVTKLLILMPAYKADGTRNGIDLDDTLNAAWIADIINQYTAAGVRVSLDERWYPTPLMEAVTDERADPLYEEFPSGKKVFIREGARSFSGDFLDAPAFELLGKVQRNACTDLAALIVDTEGNVIGDGSDPDMLMGILIDKGTYHSRLVKATDGAAQRIRLTFDWHRLAKDEDLKMIKAEDFTDFSMLDIRGSYDVYGTLGAIAQTSLIISLYTSYGSAKTPIVVSGLVAADFKLFNETDSLDVTVTGCTETDGTPGRYTLTYASQTLADVLQVRIKKAGLDGTSVEALNATVA